MGIRQFFFKNRSYTPIPLALLIIYYSKLDWKLMCFGGILILLGETIRLTSIRYAGGKTRTRLVGAPAICSDGPYSYVRNPLYLGNIIIYIGIVIFSGGGEMFLQLLILTIIFFFLQYGIIISLEEEVLKKKFGKEYDFYRDSVPRLIPKISPWRDRIIIKPRSWEKTLMIERRTLQSMFIALLIVLLRGLLII